MANLMDNVRFTPSVPHNNAPTNENIFDIIKRAQEDPLGFEEMVKRTNPEGYQRAVQIRNCTNPKAIALEMARAQGIDPNILSMLGLH